MIVKLDQSSVLNHADAQAKCLFNQHLQPFRGSLIRKQNTIHISTEANKHFETV